MSVKEDFAFILYCATFACWMVAYAVAYLTDDIPPDQRWYTLLALGATAYALAVLL